MPLESAKQTADFLGITAQRLYEMVRLDIIPAVRMGRRIMFDRQAIDAWLKAGGRSFPGGWRRNAREGVRT